MKTTYIHELPEDTQEAIRKDIYKALEELIPNNLTTLQEEFEIATSSRIGSLENLIDIGAYKVVCGRCGTPVVKTPVKGYSYYCPEHDEDLYNFETEIVKLNA